MGTIGGLSCTAAAVQKLPGACRQGGIGFCRARAYSEPTQLRFFRTGSDLGGNPTRSKAVFSHVGWQRDLLMVGELPSRELYRRQFRDQKQRKRACVHKVFRGYQQPEATPGNMCLLAGVVFQAFSGSFRGLNSCTIQLGAIICELQSSSCFAIAGF